VLRTLTISPKSETFKHAGDLPRRPADNDPRIGSFSFERVDVDLRRCAFVRPPAMLWCLVYLALARKREVPCRLLVPENFGVSVHLKSVGLFAALQRFGVEVDDRGVPDHPGGKIIMPIEHFDRAAGAHELTNRAFDTLRATDATAAGLSSVLSELFSELAINAVQHSESPIGAFACIQLMGFETGRRFSCVVADGGIGVRESLAKNPRLRDRFSYDWDALELAVRERVSGTGDPNRGIGLYGVSEDIRRPGRSFLLHSGRGSLEIGEKLESAARRTTLFPGTLAHLAIPA
jgi:hypothetical protein